MSLGVSAIEGGLMVVVVVEAVDFDSKHDVVTRVCAVVDSHGSDRVVLDTVDNLDVAMWPASAWCLGVTFVLMGVDKIMSARHTPVDYLGVSSDTSE